MQPFSVMYGFWLVVPNPNKNIREALRTNLPAIFVCSSERTTRRDRFAFGILSLRMMP